MTELMTKRKLQEVLRKLSERDFEILYVLLKYRFMTTHHLRRLLFTNNASKLAALRASNRILAKLREYEIIDTLNRRIGGIRAGSGAFVWTLTPNGIKLLAMQNKAEDILPRKRTYEPSTAFLEHTLAVTETAVRLHELHAAEKLSLTSTANEPDCWRIYSGAGGEAKTLKPDMCAVTVIGEYEDSWFLELDLASEAPKTILSKCMQYIAYCKTGAEQHKRGVFPYVVFIVPDRKRQENLERHILKGLPEKEHRLFLVIVMEELEPLLLKGAEKFNKERKTP